LLALLALLAQLALSFGHVHLPHAALATPGIASTTAPDSAPADQDHDDDYCAICAILALLSGAQGPAAPMLPQLAAVVIPVPPSSPTALRLIAQHVSFQSRAPPNS
jgi:hypothetical protein